MIQISSISAHPSTATHELLRRVQKIPAVGPVVTAALDRVNSPHDERCVMIVVTTTDHHTISRMQSGLVSGDGRPAPRDLTGYLRMKHVTDSLCLLPLQVTVGVLPCKGPSAPARVARTAALDTHLAPAATRLPGTAPEALEEGFAAVSSASRGACHGPPGQRPRTACSSSSRAEEIGRKERGPRHGARLLQSRSPIPSGSVSHART